MAAPTLLALPTDVLLEVVSHCRRIELWRLRQCAVMLRRRLDALPCCQLLLHLSNGLVSLEEFEFPAPAFKASLACAAASRPVVVDYTAAFGPGGEVLAAARFQCPARCPLQQLFSTHILASAEARLLGRTFLLSAPSAPLGSRASARHRRHGHGHPLRTRLTQISDADQPVPHSVLNTPGLPRNVFVDTDGRAYRRDAPTQFTPLPGLVAGEHYDAHCEAAWCQAISSTHVLYVVEKPSRDEPQSRVVVLRLPEGEVVVPCPQYDGRLTMLKGSASVALGAETLAVFPVVEGAVASVPMLLTLHLATRVASRLPLPAFLLSVHTQIMCHGTETFLFYSPPEPEEEGLLIDAESGSDSDSESGLGAAPAPRGRRLTAYRVKGQRLQAVLNLRQVYGYVPLHPDLLVFTKCGLGLVDLATGARFAARRLPAPLALAFDTLGPLEVQEGLALRVLLKERTRAWGAGLACLTLAAQG